jgi:xanthine/uracil/vitamin C permease (AzgA family)
LSQTSSTNSSSRPVSPPSGNGLFQLAANGTSVRTEVLAGVTTFLTMAAGRWGEVGGAVWLVAALSVLRFALT